MSEVIHTPVMSEQILSYLPSNREGFFLDCTVGTGGHAEALLTHLEEACLVGIDWDSEALSVAKQRLAPFGKRVQLVKASFADLDIVLAEMGIEEVIGVLFDLGLSSLQLDEPRRGFTFRQPAPLDMRMDPSAPKTAAELLNSAGAGELEKIFLDYGEERWARRIAEFVVRERQAEPIDSTQALVATLRRAVPAHFRRGRRQHFATRVFQALRIAVNGELRNLHLALPKAVALLCPGARLCVISYHSLEDRIVKHYFKQAEGCELAIHTKRPVRPSSEEVADNPRSRSAKLRVAEKIEHA